MVKLKHSFDLRANGGEELWIYILFNDSSFVFHDKSWFKVEVVFR
jgi:hypothetical protein